MKRLIPMMLMALAICSCTNHPAVPTQFEQSQAEPDIFPDYKDVVVPPNIAPLNFRVNGEPEEVVARFTCAGTQTTFGSGYKVMIDEGEWADMLAKAKGSDIKVEVFAKTDGRWTAYAPFAITVAEEEIDPYISYRLIYPSYVAYEMLSITQRNVTNFDENDIYNNMIATGEADGQCINCHNYQNYKTQNMQFHMRQGLGGTMIVRDGIPSKVNLKTDSTISAGVYPSWHPTLPLIAYSTNHTGQSFHTKDNAKIEVQDTESDLILYDVDRNEVHSICNDTNELECFPCWAPDGKYLYFASAHVEYRDTVPHETELIQRYREVRYDLYRKSFNAETMTFGDAELLYEASADSLSATFPRISPDGRYLLFGRAPYGCFHVWHPTADLCIMDIATRKVRPLTKANSPRAESFHAWSSNGRWIVFISRRNDNNFSRLFFSYIDRNGREHKAFQLPQRDPDFYTYFMRSYNAPEFMVEPVTVTPQEFASAAKQPAVPATYSPIKCGKGVVRQAVNENEEENEEENEKD